MVVSFTLQLLYSGGKARGTKWICGWMCPRIGLSVLETRKIPCPWRKINHDASAVQSAAWSLHRLRHPDSNAISFAPSLVRAHALYLNAITLARKAFFELRHRQRIQGVKPWYQNMSLFAHKHPGPETYSLQSWRLGGAVWVGVGGGPLNNSRQNGERWKDGNPRLYTVVCCSG